MVHISTTIVIAAAALSIPPALAAPVKTSGPSQVARREVDTEVLEARRPPRRAPNSRTNALISGLTQGIIKAGATAGLTPAGQEPAPGTTREFVDVEARARSKNTNRPNAPRRTGVKTNILLNGITQSIIKAGAAAGLNPSGQEPLDQIAPSTARDFVDARSEHHCPSPRCPDSPYYNKFRNSRREVFYDDEVEARDFFEDLD